MRKRFLIIFSALFFMAPALSGQTARSPERAIAVGDSLFRACQFQQALSAYSSAVQDQAVSLSEVLERRKDRARNALAMTDYCATPRVLARKRLSRADFYLYYPLPQGSWHPSPNPFDPEGEDPVYLPEGADRVFYSAPDLSGSRSLFLSEDLDSVWRTPRHPAEALVSSGTEVFPMLSPDSRTLYFASDGLPGMGGLDLFSSTWDEANATWSAPVNMGIPFNSPADDFLLQDSEDGKYTLFASNRSCEKDSVDVFVLEFEESPHRMAVRDPEALQQLEALVPVEGATVSARSRGNGDTRRYMRMMAEVRALRDSLYLRETFLDNLRQRLALAEGDVAAALSAQIRSKEEGISLLKRQMDRLFEDIHRVERSFLRKGVSATASEEDSLAADQKEFVFEKHGMGAPLTMRLGEPETGYLFEISEDGGFALNKTLPEGIVYQIFLVTAARHLPETAFPGLYPVYERLNSQLRYSYYAGLFYTYRSALLQLNRVRALGYPDARIVAYSDGRSIPVNQARQEE